MASQGLAFPCISPNMYAIAHLDNLEVCVVISVCLGVPWCVVTLDGLAGATLEVCVCVCVCVCAAPEGVCWCGVSRSSSLLNAH